MRRLFCFLSRSGKRQKSGAERETRSPPDAFYLLSCVKITESTQLKIYFAALSAQHAKLFLLWNGSLYQSQQLL